MLEMVEARRNADTVEQRHDLFSGLLKAADDGEALNDDELIGKHLVTNRLISWKM
jgi:cytochrome P450